MVVGEGSSAQLSETQWQDIIRRVRKVQALTDSPNVNEAANAAAKLQELLFRYNLTLSQIDSSESNDDSPYVTRGIDVGFAMGDTGDWRIMLITYIAQFNFCRAIFTEGSTEVSVLGEPHNLEVTEHLYDYLAGEVVRLAKREWKSYNRNTPFDREKAIAWVRPFCQGAMTTIRERLSEQFHENQIATEQTQALVVAKEHQVAEALAATFPNLQHHDYEVTATHAGYTSGRRAANEISLAKQVHAGSKSENPSISG